MTIILYNNYSENNALSKRPEMVAEYTDCVARNALDVKDPIITLQSDTEITANYAYIPENNRYYFIEPPEKTRNRFYTLRLHVDVLKTYAAGIYAQTAIIDRATGVFDAYLPDTESKFESYTRTLVKPFYRADVAGVPVILNYDNSRAVLVTAG